MQVSQLESHALNDSPYREKVAELLSLIEASHTPPWVKLMVPRLTERHDKLFVMVGKPQTAHRAMHLEPGIYPSNYLCELVEALRALDWPKVRILVHEAILPNMVRLNPNPANLRPPGEYG